MPTRQFVRIVMSGNYLFAVLRRLLLLTAFAVLACAGTANAQSLSINDVSLNEGSSGTTTFSFTVLLDTPAGPGGVTFDIATADGTALAGSDYVAKSLTGQTIPQGSDGYSFSVTVTGDTAVESDETFFVNVTNVTGATTTDAQGEGTIFNDDVSADLSVVHDVTSSPPRAGQTVTLQTTVTNDGPNPATAVTLTLPLPNDTTFQSLSSPAAWACTTPPVGGTGTVTCTSPSRGVGASTLTMVVAVGAVAGGTTLSSTASVSASTPDVDTADLSDPASVVVAATSDLGVALGAPASVVAGQDLTLTATVDSDGPDPAAGAEVELTLPSGATLRSLTAPAGWTCTTPAVGAAGTATCTRSSAAVGTSVFTLVARAAGAAGTTITATAATSTTSFDADSTNDGATSSTTVTAPPVVQQDPKPEPQPQPQAPSAPAVAPVLPPAPPARPLCGRIPTLTGRTAPGARLILSRDRCGVRVAVVRKGRSRKGFRRVRVVAQSLKPGTPVLTEGTTLTLTFSPIADARPRRR